MSKSERRRKFEKKISVSQYNKAGPKWMFRRAGFGKGKVNWCPECDTVAHRSYLKQGKWYCREHNVECIEKERE